MSAETEHPPLAPGPPTTKKRWWRLSGCRAWFSAKWRWIGPVVMLLAYVSAGAALWGAGYWLIRIPWLGIHEIIIVGNEQADRQGIRDCAGVRLGSPLLALDVHAVVGGVESAPWVKRAQVARRLPDQVRIEVVERTAVGVFRADRLHIVDEEGYTTPVNGAVPPNLPIITGLDVIPPPQKETHEAAGRVLAVVAELPILRNTVSELSLSDSTRIILVLSPRGTLVSLPRDAGRDRLVMVASVIAHEPDLLLTASHLDARFLGHLAVTFPSPSRNGKV